MTTVVNKYKEKYDAYCGRGTIWGNPYEIGIDGNRDEVIERYRKWFNFVIKDEVFKNSLLKLKDKKIACFCAPQKCHLDIIAEYLNNL